MDVVVNTEKFKAFLERCHLQGIIKDLVIHTTGQSGLMSKFSDKGKSMYCEVYLSESKTHEEGNIRVPSLKKIIEIMKRCDSELIRIKSTKDAIAFTDGNVVGKFNANILQSSDAELVESYDPIAKNLNLFDKTSLCYVNGIVNYKNGFELPISMLVTVVEDAKAFSYEVFTLEYVKGNLKCKLENTATTEKFTRVISDGNSFGDVASLPSVELAMGFKEMVKCLDKTCGKEQIKLYIDEKAVLFTNGKDVFYNLNCI